MKKIVITTMVAAFVLSAGFAVAAKISCTVDKVEGDQVTMTCKKADSLKAGTAVKVKVAKKKKAIEGC